MMMNALTVTGFGWEKLLQKMVDVRNAVNVQRPFLIVFRKMKKEKIKEVDVLIVIK